MEKDKSITVKCNDMLKNNAIYTPTYSKAIIDTSEHNGIFTHKTKFGNCIVSKYFSYLIIDVRGIKFNFADVIRAVEDYHHFALGVWYESILISNAYLNNDMSFLHMVKYKKTGKLIYPSYTKWYVILDILRHLIFSNKYFKMPPFLKQHAA